MFERRFAVAEAKLRCIDLLFASVHSQDRRRAQHVRGLCAVCAGVGPHCAADVPGDCQCELHAGQPRVGSERCSTRHRHARVEPHLAARTIDLARRAAIQDDDSAHSPVGYDHIAATPEHQERPASSRGEAHDATQGKTILDRDKEIGWASDAHGGVGRKRLIGDCAQSEAALHFASRHIALGPRPGCHPSTHCPSTLASWTSLPREPPRADAMRRSIPAIVSAAPGRAIDRAAAPAALRAPGAR